MSGEKEVVPNVGLVAGSRYVLYAEAPPGITLGAVSDAEPSSLALLAAGVAGMAARRARRSARMRSSQTEKTGT